MPDSSGDDSYEHNLESRIDPNCGISQKPIDEETARRLYVELTKAEASLTNAKSSWLMARSQSDMSRYLAYGILIMAIATCAVIIFGACNPKADHEFLKAIVLGAWDRGSEMILIVLAYWFGGVNGRR
jgi:hypothetical protein